MNYPQQMRQILEFASGMIFPIRCLECSRFSGFYKRDYICRKCLNGIAINRKLKCIGCEVETGCGKTCSGCKNINSVDQFFVLLDYKNQLAIKIIKCFKYRFVREIVNPLSVLIKKYLIMLAREKKCSLAVKNPVIVPVPLHPRRLNWRGFNQSELIAQSLADILQCQVEPNILRRIRESRPQAEIKDKEERLKKPLDAFEVASPAPVKNRAIVLVDDVATTGATLNECARILKENGAAEIIGFVVAKG